MPSLTIVFYVLAAVAVGSGILMITRRNAMQSALFLILNFIALAGLYLTLSAQFVAIIQILVYAGAIMVLVLFVIMLLNLEDEPKLREQTAATRYTAAGLGVALLALIVFSLNIAGADSISGLTGVPSSSVQMGTVENIGMVLFTDYVFPVEVTSILLLAAVIGAVVLAKKKFP